MYYNQVTGLEIFENMFRTNVLEAKIFTGKYDYDFQRDTINIRNE